MSSAEDEGSSFASAFLGTFGAVENTEKRLKAERRASMTPKQRARKAVRTEQVNFRASRDTKMLIMALAQHLDCSAADAIEKAIMALAASERVTVKGGKGAA